MSLRTIGIRRAHQFSSHNDIRAFYDKAIKEIDLKQLLWEFFMDKHFELNGPYYTTTPKYPSRLK